MSRNNKLSEIRRSRVLDYGPGSIIDFTIDTTGSGSVSVVSAGLEYWNLSTNTEFAFDKQTIHEDRLKKKLQVQGFRLPPINGDSEWKFKNDSEAHRTLWGFRFPRYLICPNCRTLKWYTQWENLKYGDPQKICSSCSEEERKKGRTNKIFVVPSRFVVACKNGHLSDFPWFYWVHGKYEDGECKYVFNKNIFKLLQTGKDMGLSGLILKCMNCGKDRPMEGIFSEKSSLHALKCTGQMPWIKQSDGIKDFTEKCDLHVDIRQRGAGDLYKPLHMSSLTIPPFDDKSLKLINDLGLNVSDLVQPNITDSDRVAIIRISSKKIGKELTEKELKEINEKVIEFDKFLKQEKSLHWEEYQRFTKEHEITSVFKNYSRDLDKFEIRTQKIPKNLSKYLTKLVKVVRLRETRALVGFTRIVDAVDYKTPAKNNETGKDYKIGLLEQKKSKWYPAIEVKGEGIFISLNEKRLEEWSKNKHLVKRAENINKKFKSNLNKEVEDLVNISPRYLLIHTLSHALITELAKVCGYSEASMRERLYISEKKEEKMSGILIYTSSSDSEGTLGGLSRQANPERFEKIFINAIRGKYNCSQDPHCIMGIKSASEEYNEAACHSCLLLPETSCEKFNRFLDRATIRGDIENNFKSYFDF